MTDLAGRTTGGTASVVVIAVLALLLLAAVTYAAVWRIFTDAGEKGWKSLVPIWNVRVLLRITDKPAWWLVLFLIPVVNLVVGVPTMRALARSYGRGRAFTAGLVLLGFVFLPVLAFGAERYHAPGDAAPDARPTSRGPWLSAATALVAAVVLAVLYFTVSGTDAPAGSLNDQERQAVTAAGTIAANLTTFSRADFSHDFARALNQTTGSLHTDLSKARAATLSTLTQGKFDLTSTVRHTALVGPAEPSGSAKTAPEAYVVLVNIYGYQSVAPTNPMPQNLQITVQLVKGTWLASGVSAVNVQ